MDLLVKENRFHAAVLLLNERSSLLLKEAQPLLESAGIVEGDEYTREQIAAALVPRSFPMLQRYTEQVISHIDQTVLSLHKMSKRLHNALTSL